jgi:CheY-like chemotaxis protein
MNDSRWILVVDDDVDIRETLALLLEVKGFIAVGAGDGLEALDQIRAHGRPGVVLLDLRMPRMNGPDFARALHADPTLASIPIVVLSGDATAPDVAAELGARGLLRKPIELDELLGVVRALIPPA